MTIHSRSLAVLATAIAALSSVAGASAMTKTHVAKPSSHAKVTKKTTAAARTTKGTGTVRPIQTGPAVAAISAFPTGGKGSPPRRPARCGPRSSRPIRTSSTTPPRPTRTTRPGR